MMDKKVLTIAAVGALAIFLLRKQAAQAVRAVDPTSTNNIFYRGVNAVGDVLDDGNASNDSFTLGGALYDLFNPELQL